MSQQKGVHYLFCLTSKLKQFTHDNMLTLTHKTNFMYFLVLQRHYSVEMTIVYVTLW